MYSKTQSAMLFGLDADLISVEVQISKGIPNFIIIGLASKAIVEAKERVSSAMMACEFPIPPKRLLVNLSPADLKKDGPQFDLAIAAGLMHSLGYINPNAKFMADSCFIAELSITGKFKAVRGTLALISSAVEKGIKQVFTAAEALEELSILCEDKEFTKGTKVYLLEDLQNFKKLFDSLQASNLSNHEESLKSELINSEYELENLVMKNAAAEHLVSRSRKINNSNLAKEQGVYKNDENPRDSFLQSSSNVHFSDVVGQSLAKRAIEIALAGKHHLLMIGPPGCGKSMLAKSILSLLDDLSFKQKLETRMLSDLARISLTVPHESYVPFRSPHSSSTAVSMIGGGVPIFPGEVSLAHNGILFLDELAEFDRFTIDQLRTVLDNSKVFLNKGNQKIVFPADFLLIAASNPCPCGYLGDVKKICTCSPAQIQRYQSKISGPILDRIDLSVTLSRLSEAEMRALSGDLQPRNNTVSNADTDLVKQRIKQAKVFSRLYGANRVLDKVSQDLLNAAVMRFDLSSRSHQKIISIARTIANLDESENIKEEHVAEALQYRER
ncbi:MAG: YifB family Mg chelatase-like AAA ATPase [bacterium]